MKFEFKHIKEIDEILPRNVEGEGFKKLINKYFDYDKDNNYIGEEDLVFCLIEITNLKKEAYGERYIKSDFDADESEEYLKRYEKTVAKVKKEFGDTGSPSAHSNWYNKSTFIYLSSQNSEIKKNDTVANWIQSPKSQHVPKDRTSYAKADKHILDVEIKEYLSFYVEKLEEDLGFDKFPYYAVIVRPISIKKTNKKDSIPLGNMYLHFGTNTYKSEVFYKNLINDFMLVWNEIKGFETIEKYKKQSIINEKSKDLSLFSITPVKEETAKKRKYKEISLYQYFDEVTKNSDLRDEFNANIELVKENSCPAFLKIKELLSKKENSVAEINKLFKDAFFIYDEYASSYYRLENLNKNIDYNFFVKILVQRVMVIVAYMVYEIDLIYIKNFIYEGDFNGDTTYDDFKDFFNIQRCIPTPIKRNIQKTIPKLSQFEQKLLNDLNKQ